jgi:hypothetical protein
MPTLFELSLPDETPIGLIGPWQAGASMPVSFAAGESAAQSDAPVWKVSLSADPLEAEQALSEAEAQIAAAEAALDEIPARLDAITSARPRGGQVSFDVASFGVEADSPEASMLDLLDHARALEQGRTVSFGVTDFASAAWDQARLQFEAFVGQLQREVFHFAWVETNIEGQLLARTSVGWSGDSSTVWLEDAGAEQFPAHRRALRVAVKSRALRMRMFSTVTGGAAKLSLLLTTPAGAVLALPAAWKYVTEILAQIKSYQTLTQGGSNGK